MSNEIPTPDEIEAMLAVDANAGSIQPSTTEKGILADNILKNINSSETKKEDEITLDNSSVEFVYAAQEALAKTPAEQKALEAKHDIDRQEVQAVKEYEAGLKEDNEEKVTKAWNTLQDLKAQKRMKPEEKLASEAFESTNVEGKFDNIPLENMTESQKQMELSEVESLENKFLDKASGPVTFDLAQKFCKSEGGIMPNLRDLRRACFLKKKYINNLTEIRNSIYWSANIGADGKVKCLDMTDVSKPYGIIVEISPTDLNNTRAVKIEGIAYVEGNQTRQ